MNCGGVHTLVVERLCADRVAYFGYFSDEKRARREKKVTAPRCYENHHQTLNSDKMALLENFMRGRCQSL